MAAETNVAPYYDDYNEEKNFHRILFKPGVAVQSRELTQSQTILQNQVKRIGDYLFTDGELVQGASPSINADARTIRIKDTDSRGRSINHTDYLGKYVRTTSDSSPIGYVEFTFSKDNPNIGDPISFVISLRRYNKEDNDNLNVNIFAQETELLFYDDYIDCLNLDPNIQLRATTVRDISRNAYSTTKLYSKEIILSNPSDQIEVGDLLIHPLLTKKIYVTQILSTIQIVVSEEPEVVIANDLIQYVKKCVSPTSILTQDVSIFYKDGYFVRCPKQRIVPDKDTSFPSVMIGLYSEQQIITSNDDNSLLDPALESSNYFATGADRLKVDLSLASLPLDSEGNVETTDDFIPLLKFNKGVIEYVKITDLRSSFDDKLAERTYDESGNYVVDNFTILPEESAVDSETLLLKASAGKAYVGGYQVKTIGPTEIRIPKNTKTETKEFYNVNTTQGNYIKIGSVEGILPRPQSLIQSETFLELHSVLDEEGIPSGEEPTDDTTRVGILAFKGIEYDSFYTDNLVYKLFSHYIALKPDAPLSWEAWAEAYNIPEDEGRYVSSVLYEGEEAIGTVKEGATNITIYGLYREPDASGLAFWYRRYRENGKNIDNILQAFYDAATGLDKTRLTQSSKSFLSVINGSPFYDGITNTSKVTHIIGVPNEYTDHEATGSYSSPFFKANVHSTGRDVQNQLIIFDKKPSDRLLFPIGKNFVKSVSKLQTSYTKVFRGVSFVSGTYTLTLSLPESLPIGDGTVPASTARANFALIVRTGATSSVPLGSWGFESGSVIISGSSASITINTGDASFTGTADLMLTIENDNLTQRIKKLVEYNTKIIDIDTADKDYSLGKADIFRFRGVYKLEDFSAYKGNWSSSTAYTYNSLVTDRGQLYQALLATTGVDTNFANAWLPVQPEIITNYVLDNGQRDSLYDHGYIKYLGSSADIPGNVLVTFDYFTHTGEGPVTVNSYDANLYSEVPSYRSIIDSTNFILRDCLDFRPRRKDDVDYFDMQTSVFPTSSVNTEITVEYYLGRKDRIYVTTGLQNVGSPYNKFYHVKGIESTDPIEPEDESDLTKLSLCVLDIPPYAVSSFDVRFTYDDNARYTMKDIGNLSDSVIKLEKAVKLQSVEVAALKSIILDDDDNVLLKSGIFIDDFSSLDKADLTSGFFSVLIDEDSQECFPGFTAYNIDMEPESELDIDLMNDIVTMKYVEEPFIIQDELNFTLTVNPGAVDDKRGRAVISRKNSLSVNMLLTGGALLSSAIALKTISAYVVASAQGTSTSILSPTSGISRGSSANFSSYVGEGSIAIAWNACRDASFNFLDSVVAISTISRLLSGPAQFVADASTFVYEFISGGFSTVLPALSGDGQATTQNIFASNVITASAEFFPQYSAGLSKIILILATILNGSYGSGISGLQAGLNSLTASITTGSYNSLILKADAASLAAVGKQITRGGSGGNIITDILDFVGSVVGGILKGAVSIIKGIFKIFSDSRMKTNIKYIRTLKSGLNIYSFEYKKEFKEIAGYGKYFGYLADEVEKIFPKAVCVHDNGYKMINYSLIGN
jgi:hypothetical protein